jgi:diadenosine tetraphosphatase ApaH/serine/threonine PP2A family protein phosphatase
MRIALLSDVHANLQALEACLAAAWRAKADRYVFLGDLVGYGGDPEAVVNRIRGLCEAGAVSVRGNHDLPHPKELRDFSDNAASSARWTIEQLDDEQCAFLRSLPLTILEDDRLYVHADASDPARWRYVTDELSAERSLAATQARLVLCGHVHTPQLYALNKQGKISAFTPTTDEATPLSRTHRWHIVLGSVGQPRDGDPRAAFAILESSNSSITFHRVHYDIDAAARAIRNAGLPEGLARRLYVGS